MQAVDPLKTSSCRKHGAVFVSAEESVITDAQYRPPVASITQEADFPADHWPLEIGTLLKICCR